MFTGKPLLITGGTRTFENAVLRRFLATDIKEIRIFYRDTHDAIFDLFECQKATVGFSGIDLFDPLFSMTTESGGCDPVYELREIS